MSEKANKENNWSPTGSSTTYCKFCNPIGQDPVEPEAVTKPHEIFTGSKVDCKDFAAKWNWFRAVWEIHPVIEKDSEIEVVFLHSLRPHHDVHELEYRRAYNQPKKSKKSEAGYTVIELMIVTLMTILILGAFCLLVIGGHYFFKAHPW
jgi:hypothetical protein